jgi:hypothetical protein
MGWRRQGQLRWCWWQRCRFGQLEVQAGVQSLSTEMAAGQLISFMQYIGTNRTKRRCTAHAYIMLQYEAWHLTVCRFVQLLMVCSGIHSNGRRYCMNCTPTLNLIDNLEESVPSLHRFGCCCLRVMRVSRKSQGRPGSIRLAPHSSHVPL